MITVLETSRVPPPPGAATELRQPLAFLDYLWLHFHPVRHLLFYDYPSCSKAYFMNTLVPKLKESLSLTLNHYLPVAGNLLYPLHTDQKKPFLRYLAGDSVSVTIAESSMKFDELTANHPQDADQFYDFVPQMLPPVGDDPEYKIVPVFSLQVTLFPDRGICLGISNHHCLGDASAIVGFMKAFAAINKFGRNEESWPVFDRGVIQDTQGIDTVFWKEMKQIPFHPSSSFPVPTNRVRATFILGQDDINKLKKTASRVDRASSFVVATSYIWSCLAKSAGKEVESEMFIFSADARPLIKPPAPANYFGNCLFGAVAIIEHKKLVGDEGFLIAASAIAEEIKYLVNNTEEFINDAKNWLTSMDKFRGMKASQLAVSGSPKFDWCGTDFGWGKVRKVEVVSMDGEEYSMSLSKCMEWHCQGGLEVGLSLPRERMNAFQLIFAEGLRPQMCDD
ncbi:hypothetical protein ACS0TY_026153 [Phlomoides rotata]